ncbi:DUF5672 family protein [Rhizobacter sp. SG703]|uniref:DUF5672 family protein n=1 Tax=Rhizobacter sp. SG703 TaxID=2587140 RepID=UPI0014468D9C|nr:DUF5672 family protein [Rhizobacter sp. SG703]NKI93422.1 hypothetical protein [Rhizobacter sp. SG703]
MTSLSLPQVTLCCVDSTPRLDWSLKALRRCLAQVSFGDAFLCTDRASLAGQALPDGLRWIEIAPLDGIEVYSDFMIKGLAPHLRTSHLLVVQWDGYVLNPSAWRDEFLSVDYIGAPWNHIPQPWKVGNGGFSLRSARLLQALQDPAFVPAHPEDLYICKTQRTALEARGLRFAPLEMAERFAVEDGALSAGVFGFHGPYHLPALLPPAEVLAFVESLPTRALRAHYFGSLLRELVRGARRDPALQPALAAFERLVLRAIDEFDDPASLSPQALGMLKALIRHGPHAAAARLLARRRAASGRRFGEPKLWLRLQYNALRAAVQAR